MAVITLLSDWGPRDHYGGAVKGAILRRLPSAAIVDITHHIDPFNIPQASFVLRNAYPYFPEGTIHIVAINTDESIQTSHLAAYHNGHYFIGTDNGIFSLAFDTIPEKVVEMDILQDTGYFTFSACNRFVNAACHLAEGHPIEKLGNPTRQILELHNFRPVLQPSLIQGKVMYVDGYENLITNITEATFKEIGRNRPFTIHLRKMTHRMKKVNLSYQDVGESMIVVLFGTTGLLEIAINRGNASSLLGLSVDDAIRIEFEEQ